jgi:putative MFS transporter
LIIKPVNTASDASSYWEMIIKYPSRVALIFLIWFGIATAVYGVYAWGPTIISLSRGVTPQQAAQMFLIVSILGVAGKTFFSFVPQWIGRKAAGQLSTGIGLIMLACAAFTHSMDIWGFPLFLLFVAIGDFFYEGGAAGISPYSAEVFPVRLAGRGAAIGQFGSGVGKIVGPLALAMIAGTSNVVAPKATTEAILPGFLFLTGCLVITFLAFTFFGVETRGMQLAVDDDEVDATGVDKFEEPVTPDPTT